MKIAKYRKEGFPNEWWLTDFTMEQVENILDSFNPEKITLQHLAYWEGLIYTYEKEFLKEFTGVDNAEFLEVYFSAEAFRFYFVSVDGQTIGDSDKIEKFIAWVDKVTKTNLPYA